MQKSGGKFLKHIQHIYSSYIIEAKHFMRGKLDSHSAQQHTVPCHRKHIPYDCVEAEYEIRNASRDMISKRREP